MTSKQRCSAHPAQVVEITGGEPLLQANVHPLMTRLADHGRTVLLETSGACDISTCDPRVHRIVDLKTPESGEMERNDFANLEHLTMRDEIKFVIGSRRDYEWARDLTFEARLHERCRAVLFSPVHEQPRGLEIAGAPGLDRQSLVEWMLADGVPARFQVQLHKFIWDPATRGV